MGLVSGEAKSWGEGMPIVAGGVGRGGSSSFERTNGRDRFPVPLEGGLKPEPLEDSGVDSLEPPITWSPFPTSGGRVPLRPNREGEGVFSDRSETSMLSLVNLRLRLLKLNLFDKVGIG